MNSFEYVVIDEVGLHARPASQLVKFLEGFSSEVSIAKGDTTVDAKRMFKLMSLAVKVGDIVTFTLEGENAATEVVTLEQFCKDTF